MSGVSVAIKGTTRGTTTDAEGGFKIEVGNKAILSFSFVGFGTKEVSVTDGQSVVNVSLSEQLT